MLSSNPNLVSKEWLTTGEIAEWCGVNYRTVIRWVRAGRLKAYRLPGSRGDHRVQMADFEAFLKENNLPLPLPQTLPETRVLIIEDDLGMSAFMEAALNEAGFKVRTAYSGFAAGSMLLSFSPTIITLDLNVPDLNGLEVIRLIRRMLGNQIAILVVTGMDEEERCRALDYGADWVLFKPVDYKKLVEKVKALSLRPATSGRENHVPGGNND